MYDFFDSDFWKIVPIYVQSNNEGIYQIDYESQESEFNSDEENYSDFGNDSEKIFKWRFMTEKFETNLYYYEVIMDKQSI